MTKHHFTRGMAGVSAGILTAAVGLISAPAGWAAPAPACTSSIYSVPGSENYCTVAPGETITLVVKSGNGGAGGSGGSGGLSGVWGGGIGGAGGAGGAGTKETTTFTNPFGDPITLQLIVAGSNVTSPRAPDGAAGSNGTLVLPNGTSGAPGSPSVLGSLAGGFGGAGGMAIVGDPGGTGGDGGAGGSGGAGGGAGGAGGFAGNGRGTGSDGFAGDGGFGGAGGDGSVSSVLVPDAEFAVLQPAAGTGGTGGTGGAGATPSGPGAVGIDGISGTDGAPGNMSTTWTEAPFIQIIDGSVPVDEEGSGPPVWWQSVGRSAGGICDPGWGPSWAQWAVPITGGPVCNRVVFWDGSRWMQSTSLEDTNNAKIWDGKR